jgi:hypothetical protein
MKRIKFFFVLLAIIMSAGFASNLQAQSSPVLYFCESYGSNGEINISDRFHTGYLTVMVKADDALGLKDCSIQFDKYNSRTSAFDYYKKFTYVVKPTMKYIYFERNSTSDMSFEEPGIYRVFLLDDRDRTVASGLIEIIP